MPDELPQLPEGFSAVGPDDPEWIDLMNEICQWIGQGTGKAYEALPPEVTLVTWLDATEKFLQFDRDEGNEVDAEAQLVMTTVALAKAAIAYKREILRISKADPNYRDWQRRRKGAEGEN